MLEEGTLNRFASGERKAIGEALLILHKLGVFQLQVEENALRIANDMSNQSADELAKRILQVQQTNRNLLALHELAGTYAEEQKL